MIIRAAILNDCRQARKIDIAIYLDKPEQKNLLYNKTETVKAGGHFLVQFMWPALGYIGRHRISRG